MTRKRRYSARFLKAITLGRVIAWARRNWHNGGITVTGGADVLSNTLRSGASQRDMSDAAVIG
jgi:hypothetical protein